MKGLQFWGGYLAGMFAAGMGVAYSRGGMRDALFPAGMALAGLVLAQFGARRMRRGAP